MSVMNTELYNALRKINVPEDLAEAAAHSVVSYEGIASQTDINEVHSEINQVRLELKSEISQLRLEIHSEMSTMRAELIKWMVGLQSATLLALIGAVIAIMGRIP